MYACVGVDPVAPAPSPKSQVKLSGCMPELSVARPSNWIGIEGDPRYGPPASATRGPPTPVTSFQSRPSLYVLSPSFPKHWVPNEVRSVGWDGLDGMIAMAG